MKTKNNNLVSWAIIIGVIILFAKLDWAKPTAEDFFTEKEKANTNLGENLGNGVATDSIANVDLCASLNTMQSLGVEAQCRLIGGIWTCEKSNVGCYGFNQGALDCSTSQVKSAIAQCISLGAHGSCELNNVYCRY